MPKHRSKRSSSSNGAKASSPYTGDSKAREPECDKNEWESALCPICMDHPHNSVLLLCSSQEKNCRPFMCNSGPLHSNCLEQFAKSARQPGNPNPICPLCRGTVAGWTVVEPTREYMDSKARACPLETCDFRGNYEELGRHALVEHPSCKPSEVVPTRRSDWKALEQELDASDSLAYAVQLYYGFSPLEPLPRFFLEDEDGFIRIPSSSMR